MTRFSSAFQQGGHNLLLLQRPAAPGRACPKTADEVYVRLHGPKRWYRHDYSKEETDGVEAGRIKKERGAKRAWIYFNNDNDAHVREKRHCFAWYFQSVGSDKLQSEERLAGSQR